MTELIISNHKGGVTKTQTVIELSYFFMQAGSKVLVVDLDPQANVSDVLLVGNRLIGRTLPDILISEDEVRPEDIMTRSFGPGLSLDYICSSIKACRIESRITASPKEYIIGDALKNVKHMYDYIIIDTPPSSELLGLSALVDADEVIIPVTPDKLSIDGVASMMQVVKTVQNNPRLNPKLKVRGILVTRFRTTLSMLRGLKQLKDTYGDIVVATPIRECTRVQQAVECCRPVLDYDPACNASKDYLKAFDQLSGR